MHEKYRHMESVVNIIQENPDYMKEFLDRMVYEKGLHNAIFKSGNKPVEAHKAIFGKQNYCFTGEYKYWVWDFGNWRVFVSNIRGISVEVEPTFNSLDVMLILRKYWDQFGV